MNYTFDDSRPLFQQVADAIANDIIHNVIKEGEQVPSTNQFAKHHQINPATVAKGFHLLVDQGILFKKRGVGMFVAKGARDQLLEQRRETFYSDFIVPLLNEARTLHLSEEMILDLIKRGGANDDSDDHM
ncbi:GntR family transcriptional regulator [Halalkalibacterium halodurans]|uniref:GntR family transcriptional regulator n=1 Tax=Halalkalibacterium halodurans TaxID=86665 RepID=UPI002E1DB925|nr:GntR family transcriptional regulator [Halalkalibacterium halodurans]MED4080170.1 GntR family transcriptional regulator [Halalkalibacterium halodurans]MED4083393.1 GntR family transcriptional regulator [Halalkalibacterium halodurans]MED4105135.1 GntR family transcriptional regulator [Halalkalibacterium halodurans]MED4109453.1 GntR family transcriptional regulator [Halalkalibacterium halodurans]